MKTFLIVIMALILGYSYYTNTSVKTMAGMAEKEISDSGYEITMPLKKKEGI